MKIKYIIFVSLFSFFLTGCILNPYHNPKFGEKSIDAWFSYEKDDLGETRKKIENIDEIISRTCSFLEDDSINYIYKCEIVYRPIGETVIPLSKNKVINVYVCFTPYLDNTYTYRVYNSGSKEGVWLLDEELNYNKEG